MCQWAIGDVSERLPRTGTSSSCVADWIAPLPSMARRASPTGLVQGSPQISATNIISCFTRTQRSPPYCWTPNTCFARHHHKGFRTIMPLTAMRLVRPREANAGSAGYRQMKTTPSLQSPVRRDDFDNPRRYLRFIAYLSLEKSSYAGRDAEPFNGHSCWRLGKRPDA